MTRRALWTILAAIVLAGGVLSFYGATDAAPRGEMRPFANAIEQRMEAVSELREIQALLKEQNALLREQMALLRSGEVKVIVVRPERQAAEPAETN
mgnify:CR=1 FL=1